MKYFVTSVMTIREAVEKHDIQVVHASGTDLAQTLRVASK
jgi:hypothetical protein